eukprot:2712674-Rhodomonas_salina.1
MKWGDVSHNFDFRPLGSSHDLPRWAANGLAERQQSVLDHVNSFHGFIDDAVNSLSSELKNSTGDDPENVQKRMFLFKLQRLRVTLEKFTVNGNVHSNTAARRVHKTKKRPLYVEAGENQFDYSYPPK